MNALSPPLLRGEIFVLGQLRETRQNNEVYHRLITKMSSRKVGKKKAAMRLLELNLKVISSKVDYLVVKDTGFAILKSIWIDIKKLLLIVLGLCDQASKPSLVWCGS